MLNGAPYQCNPKLSGPKKGPCCSGWGHCGDTESHCSCDTCVDYSKEDVADGKEEDTAKSDADETEDAAGPDLEAECLAAAAAGDDLHSEYCGLDCMHTMCKYPVGRGVKVPHT